MKNNLTKGLKHSLQAVGMGIKDIKIPIFSALMAFASAYGATVFHLLRTDSSVFAYEHAGKLLFASVLGHGFWLFLTLGLILFLIYCGVLYAKKKLMVQCMLASLLPAVNMIVSLGMEQTDYQNIFLPYNSLIHIVLMAGFTCMWALASLILVVWMDRPREKKTLTPIFQRWYFSAVILLLCWLPGMLVCYPGSMAFDTRNQIMSWEGLKPIDSSHPILTTLIYGTMYDLGMAIKGQDIALFLCALSQALMNASFMGAAAMQVYRYTRRKTCWVLAIAFFGLLPVWQNASQLIIKDVMHTGCFLLFLIQYMRCIEQKEKGWKQPALLFLAAMLATYTRKAVFILAALSMLILVIYHWKKEKKQYIACLSVFLLLFPVYQNILCPALGILPEKQSENYSLPFQQVALYCKTYQNEMSQEEINIVDGTLDFDTIVREYTPMISDAVKATYHGSDKDHSEFWRLYIKLVFRRPLFFIKATLMSCFEHFNPWYEGVQIRVYMSKDEGFIQTDFRSDQYMEAWRYWSSWLKIPVARLLIGTGLYSWVLYYCLFYVIIRKNGVGLLGLIPSLILMLGLIMSHVNGEIRYGYPLIASAPLNVAWVIYAMSQKKKPLTNPHVQIKRTVRLTQVLQDTEGSDAKEEQGGT